VTKHFISSMMHNYNLQKSTYSSQSCNCYQGEENDLFAAIISVGLILFWVDAQLKEKVLVKSCMQFIEIVNSIVVSLILLFPIQIFNRN